MKIAGIEIAFGRDNKPKENRPQNHTKSGGLNDLTAEIQAVIDLLTQDLVAVLGQVHKEQPQYKATQSMVQETQAGKNGQRNFAIHIQGDYAALCARPMTSVLSAASLNDVDRFPIQNMEKGDQSNRKVVFSIPAGKELEKIALLNKVAAHIRETQTQYATLIKAAATAEQQFNGQYFDADGKPIMAKIFFAPIKSDQSPTGYDWRISLETNSTILKDALEKEGFTGLRGDDKTEHTSSRNGSFTHRWSAVKFISPSTEFDGESITRARAQVTVVDKPLQLAQANPLALLVDAKKRESRCG